MSRTSISQGRLLRSVRAAMVVTFILSVGTAPHRAGVSERHEGGDFSLQSGRRAVALSDFRGKQVLIYFGYLTCPDVCPNSLSRIGAALRALSPKEREQVAAVFVSVDPDRDSPERVARYAAHFDPLIVGATGTPEALQKVARRYGANFRKVPVKGALGYTVAHTSETYLVDQAGRLFETLPHGVLPGAIAAAIRRGLRFQAPQQPGQALRSGKSTDGIL